MNPEDEALEVLRRKAHKRIDDALYWHVRKYGGSFNTEAYWLSDRYIYAARFPRPLRDGAPLLERRYDAR